MSDRWEPPLPAMPAPPPQRAWHRLPVPPGYEPQWRRLVDAALEVGMGPDALVEEGMEPIAAARGWKPATVALYSKVARYGGIALPMVRTPEPDPQTLELRPLSQIRTEDPEHLRTVAWCALALGWPGTVGQFRSLRRDQVHPTARRIVVRTEDGEWSVPGALTAWHAWESCRARFPALADSPWVLPARRRARQAQRRPGGAGGRGPRFLTRRRLFRCRRGFSSLVMTAHMLGITVKGATSACVIAREGLRPRLQRRRLSGSDRAAPCRRGAVPPSPSAPPRPARRDTLAAPAPVSVPPGGRGSGRSPPPSVHVASAGACAGQLGITVQCGTGASGTGPVRSRAAAGQSNVSCSPSTAAARR